MPLTSMALVGADPVEAAPSAAPPALAFAVSLAISLMVFFFNHFNLNN